MSAARSSPSSFMPMPARRVGAPRATARSYSPCPALFAPSAAATNLDRLQTGRVPRRERDRHIVVSIRGAAPRTFPAHGITGPLERQPRVGTLLVATRAATGFDIAPAMIFVVTVVPIVFPDGADQRPENSARSHCMPPFKQVRVVFIGRRLLKYESADEFCTSADRDRRNSGSHPIHVD